MRYIDVLVNGITQNILAIDLVFESTSAQNIRLHDTYSGNLTGVNNLNSALRLMDNFSGGSGIDNTALDRTINNINDLTILYEGAPALVHMFVHNLDTEYLKFNIWVEEVSGWQNSIVPITIIDNNRVKVELTEPKSVRIIVEDISDISKTYGL